MAKQQDPEILKKLDLMIDETARLRTTQNRTNELLQKLVQANTDFLGTLTTFLDFDHRLKVEQERKREEQAKSMEPSPHDLRY